MSAIRREPVRRDDFRHWVEVEVRWGDTDALGHVNNANYLSYLEAARLSYLSERGHVPRLHTAAQGPVLASIQCDFRREIQYPGHLQVGTRVIELRTRSYVMEHGIFLEEQQRPMADGTSVLVWVDYALKKAVPLPQPLRNSIRQFDQVQET